MTTLFRSTTNTSGSLQFDLLRDALDRDAGLRSELESALRLNVHRVNPSDRANRFGSGAAVEWLLAAAAYAAGVLAVPGGHNANGFDLRDLREDARGLWSVKNQTSPRGMEYRLTNGLGGAGKGFAEATVFLSPALIGITFVDPQIHTWVKDAVQEKKDAAVLPFHIVRKHAEDHPECVARCTMPANPGTGTSDPWMNYIKELVSEQHYPNLGRMFADSTPRTSTLSSELSDLVARRDRNEITHEQFDLLIKSIAAR